MTQHFFLPCFPQTSATVLPFLLCGDHILLPFTYIHFLLISSVLRFMFLSSLGTVAGQLHSSLPLTNIRKQNFQNTMQNCQPLKLDIGTSGATRLSHIFPVDWTAVMLKCLCFDSLSSEMSWYQPASCYMHRRVTPAAAVAVSGRFQHHVSSSLCIFGLP